MSLPVLFTTRERESVCVSWTGTGPSDLSPLFCEKLLQRASVGVACFQERKESKAGRLTMGRYAGMSLNYEVRCSLEERAVARTNSPYGAYTRAYIRYTVVVISDKTQRRGKEYQLAPVLRRKRKRKEPNNSREKKINETKKAGTIAGVFPRSAEPRSHNGQTRQREGAKREAIPGQAQGRHRQSLSYEVILRTNLHTATTF